MLSAAAIGLATAVPAARPVKPAGTTLRWLGNNSWEIRFGTTTLLIDPWLTRFHTGTYTAAGPDPRTPLRIDEKIVDAYVNRADQILVCHGHYDHIADVPYIATKTGATVLGTETHLNLLRSYGIPEQQLSEVSGGEYLDFDGYSIEVFASLHSRIGKRRQLLYPGSLVTVPRRPEVISDLLEGGTLAYQITVGGSFRILCLSTANFIARELDGLCPDLVLLPAGGDSVHDFVARLMAATGNPPIVLPTHWDDFDVPLAQPAKDWGGLDRLRDSVRKASPTSRFVRLEHGETFTP